MKQKPEAKVKAAIRKYLKEIGASVATPIGSAYGRRGVSDMLVCHKGLFVAIEVKAPGKLSTVTPLQSLYLEGVRAAGGVALLVDDVESVKKVFSEL